MARRYSSEYKALQPYVVEDIRKVVNAAGASGGSAATPGVTDHGALTGLSDDDHPQYLTPIRGDARYVSSTRALTAGAGLTGGGDLSADRSFAVGAGTLITVGADDVGITAGANYQFIGTGAGTAAAWQNISGLAGSGLTAASGVLAVGAGAGLTVNADDVALTTPGTLTVSTTNVATGSHTHAITASSDVGTSPAAALLKSTAGGALTLASLFVKGSVDITNNGDLTVAGSGAYAGVNVLFADSSGGNVGINRVPDSQFALDIAGPARADYWIGPHAIQLKNVLMLCHYDGREPFATNFTGDPNGHMGQVATVVGGAIFRQGKYYKALQMAAATTNLVTNPSFEGGTTGWTWNDADASGSTPAYTNPYGYYHTGSGALRLSNTVAGENDYMSFNVTGLAASTAYTISAWCRVVSYTGAAFGSRGLTAYDLDNVSTLQTTTITAAADEWVRHVVTVYTTATAGSHTIQIRLYAPQAYVLWDSVQCEQLPYATPYCDGTLAGYSSAGVWLDAGIAGSGHGWTGTAHASTSSRASSTLTYPTAGNINPNAGTIMAWVNPAGFTGAAQTVLRLNGTTAGYIILRLSTSGYPQAYAGTAAVTYSSQVVVPDTWTHLAMTYDSVTVRIYINGVEATNGASSGFSGLPTTMYVGCYSTVDKWNGLIDDLVIVDRVMPANEIRSVYESNAPVFAETSSYVFRPTPKQLIWADEEGLWMRATDGDTVLGVYGNDAQTKSWGGQTMSAGDLLIGNASNYMFWDDSAATLTVAGNGAGLTSINGGNIQTGTVTATQIAAGTITATQIAASTITATQIAASTITSDKLSVTSLSAINANMGSLTSGSIVIGSTNKIWLNDSTDGALNIGGSTKASAPFRVTAAGALTATSATITGAITASSGGISGNFYVGSDVGASGNLYVGSNADIRMSGDGIRLVLPNLSAPALSTTIPTNSSALRWFSNIGSTWTNAANYTGQISYRDTSNKVVDWVAMSFVGSTDYATYYARAMLYAYRWNGSSGKECRIEATVDPGAGDAYVTATCKTMYVSNDLYVTNNMSALSITDRTPHYDGDALADLRAVRGDRRKGIDHGSLPAFARRPFHGKDGAVEEGRDLGAMISILTVAVQQLDARLDALEGARNGR